MPPFAPTRLVPVEVYTIDRVDDVRGLVFVIAADQTYRSFQLQGGTDRAVPLSGDKLLRFENDATAVVPRDLFQTAVEAGRLPPYARGQPAAGLAHRPATTERRLHGGRYHP